MAQRNLVVRVSGGLASDRGDRHEGVDVRRICHHADDEIERIAGAQRSCIEGELQRVDRKRVHIDGRQDGGLVVVCARG